MILAGSNKMFFIKPNALQTVYGTLVPTTEFDMEIPLTCLIYFTIIQMFPPTIDSGRAGSLLRLFDFNIWDKAISAFSHSSDASRVPSCTCLWSCILQHWHSDAFFRMWPFQLTCSNILPDHKWCHWPTVTKSMKNIEKLTCLLEYFCPPFSFVQTRCCSLATLYCKYPWRGSHLAFVVHLLLKIKHTYRIFMDFCENTQISIWFASSIAFSISSVHWKIGSPAASLASNSSFWQTSTKQSKL